MLLSGRRQPPVYQCAQSRRRDVKQITHRRRLLLAAGYRFSSSGMPYADGRERNDGTITCGQSLASGRDNMAASSFGCADITLARLE
jgi:hypothetical protein